MEKILLAFDATDVDMNTLSFGCYLARLSKAKLTGVFLDNLATGRAPNNLPRQTISNACNEMEAYSKAKEIADENIALFEQVCTRNGVTFNIHRNHGAPASEMIKESLFADIMVVDSATSFSKKFRGTPTTFVQEILKKAACPVIVAPAFFNSIDEIVFAYNGKISCLFAMKQCTYILPQLKDKKISVVQVNESGVFKDKQKHKLLEWLRGHYTDIDFVALKDNGNNTLANYLLKKKCALLVMGAYGRSFLSQFFKHSNAEYFIKTTTHPIFITHY